jgi:hypothetical protein
LDELYDKLAIGDLISRERWARDNHSFDEMAQCYHPDATVEVSWFKGSGAEFVELSRRQSGNGVLNFHVMSPSVVTVRGDRAIAETRCSTRNFWEVDGVEGSIEAFIKILWRALRVDQGWLLAGLRVIYVRDILYARNPAQPPIFDLERLAQFRQSYRYQAYHLDRLGLEPRNDLPGEDQPDSVVALRKSEREWLNA